MYLGSSIKFQGKQFKVTLNLILTYNTGQNNGIDMP